MSGQGFVASRVLLAWPIAALLVASPAAALDPTRSLVQMFHRAYTRDDGLPGAVGALTQTSDGYLWIATSSGLYRFDGVRFESIGEGRLLSRDIRSVTATPSGDLWVGYGIGGASRIRGGGIANFPQGAGGPFGTAMRLFEAPRGGGLWALASLEPWRFDGRRWHHIQGPWAPQVKNGGVWSLERGRDGTVWAKNGDGLFYCRPGCARFAAASGYAGGVMGLARAHDGRVWTSDSKEPGRMYAMPEPAEDGMPPPVHGGTVSGQIHGRIFLDRDGTLWNVNLQHGLLRARSILQGRADPNAVDAFATADGLSADLVSAFFEDREGNVWVGTNQGLDRFRPSNVVSERRIPVTASQWGYNGVRAGDALYFFASTSLDNSSLFAARRGQLYRADADGSVELILADTEMPTGMAAAADGKLWMATVHGLFKLEDRTLVREPIPPNVFQAPHSMLVAESAGGELWLAISKQGLWRRTNGAWSKLQTEVDPGIIALDAGNALWASTSSTARRYASETASVAPPLGGIGVMYPGRHGMLLGGERGLTRYDGHRLSVLDVARLPALAFTSGIVEADGQTWLATQAGILRFDTEALERAFARPGAPLPSYDLFDRQDGVSGWMQQDRISTNSALLGPDGRIWFLTDRGVIWIDPRNIYRNTTPPPVAIRSLTVNGRVHISPRDLDLPAGASNLEIDFAALSFVEPSRIRFRYRLDGVDDGWIDPGDRRQAFYTRLAPGDYRFQVIAANDAGVWNRTGAALSFTIPPTFVQSRWFLALCFALGLLVLWLAYRLRMAQVASRIRNRLEERLGERERIARELHDTLLQSVQGLVLRFQSVANRMPKDEPSRALLETALKRADDIIVDGRKRVRDLRIGDGPGDPVAILQDAADAADFDPPIPIRVVVEGKPRPIHPLVSAEIRRIAGEALFNIARHAGAHSVDATITFDERQLGVEIRDDGVGIAEPVLTLGHKEGHFGLVGMRERAERIGGKLSIDSRPGKGTDVLLTLPARLAYAQQPGDWRSRLSWWSGQRRVAVDG